MYTAPPSGWRKACGEDGGVRRALLLWTLAWTALAATAAASASAATYVGEGRNDPRVKVRFEKERNWVEGFTVRNARFVCTDGDRFRGGTTFGDMPLDESKAFEGNFENADGTQSGQVHGVLIDRGKARGSLRLRATYGADVCITWNVPWRARRI